MAVKYRCPNCGKRFVDWGAEKVKFKCPVCSDEALVRIGSGEGRVVKSLSLKRKKTAIPVSRPGRTKRAVNPEEAVLAPAELDTVVLGADDDFHEAETLPIAETAAGDVDIELPLDEVITPIEDEPADTGEGMINDWSE